MLPKKLVLILKKKSKENQNVLFIWLKFDEIEGKYDLESELQVYLQFFTELIKENEDLEKR